MDSIEELPKRIIKFRCWLPSEKFMGVPFDPFENVYDDVPGHWNDDSVFMQFTGLLDKNGKEIYEGDIIAYDLLEGLGEPARTGLKRVVKITPLGAFGQWDTNIEVLGNIYQNPDLL